MGKLRGPKWDNNYERWRKILVSWLRLQDRNRSNSEIVAAVILGLSESSKLKNGENIVDIILDLDDDDLYPTSEVMDDIDEKFQLKDEKRTIPGLSTIILTLKSKYGERDDIILFNLYDQFDSLKKDEGQDMKDYILKFEQLYKKLERKDVKLPDIMLAHKLMKGANLGKDEMIARVGMGTEEMNFARMKSILLSMTDGVVQTSSNSKVIPVMKVVKDESTEVYYQKGNHSYLKCHGNQQIYTDDTESDSTENDSKDMQVTYYQTRPIKRVRVGKDNRRGKDSNQKCHASNHPYTTTDYNGQEVEKRTMDNRNRPSKCNICRSIYHWANDCPHNRDKRKATKKKEIIL